MIIRDLIVIAVIGFAACGKSSDAPSKGSSAAQPGAALTGSWSGTWVRSVGGGGELVLTMGDKPTFRRAGTLCPPEETPATVTVSGDRVTIEVSTEAVKATYTGTRSGNEITGDLTTTCSAGTGTGTWKMTAR